MRLVPVPNIKCYCVKL